MSKELEKSDEKKNDEIESENIDGSKSIVEESTESVEVEKEVVETQENIDISSKDKDAEVEEKAVIIEARAYKTIILYASRYANKSIPQEDWKEIYGVLIGHTDEDLVYVERAEALTFGHATDVQLDERHYAFIEEIENKLYEEEKNEFIVGWFHSHPGLGLFYSYIDLINHLGFQAKNPDAIGLVFDHKLLGKKKLEKVEGTDHKITKYETGFEIYRMNDISMDVNGPEFDTNYHSVDYIVKGLNKFFFANVLSELSALVSAGKPLQSAYGEDFTLESDYTGNIQTERKNKAQETNNTRNYQNYENNILQDIPMDNEVLFDGEELFYGEKKQQFDENIQKEEKAEHLVYQGNEAFNNNDIFQGVEKYRDAIAIYEEIGNFQRVLELLKSLSENCISSDHLILADEFIEKLLKLAEKEDQLFYRGEANYLQGYLLLKKKEKDIIKSALNKIQNAAIIFENVQDYVGAAICFHKIGTVYEKQLEKYENSCLFYGEALSNYNKAIIKSHPLRQAMWTKINRLSQKVLELKEIIVDLLPKVEDIEIKKRIKNRLETIDYNF
jgi:proteasome lid subunit RPN8/RPN11